MTMLETANLTKQSLGSLLNQIFSHFVSGDTGDMSGKTMSHYYFIRKCTIFSSH